MTAVLARSELGVARRIEISCLSALVVSAVAVLLPVPLTRQLACHATALSSQREYTCAMYKGVRLMIVDQNAIHLARVPSGGPILPTWCRAMNRHYLEYSRRQSVILSRYS